MEKERKITAPEGCEIEKVEIVDGVAVVTFRQKERTLPKSWEEFCETCTIKEGETFISQGSKILEFHGIAGRDALTDRNVLPDRSDAEAVLALCQLIQLRNAYNGDWVPDWANKNEKKFLIHVESGNVTTYYWCILAYSPLYFKTEELRDEFMRNFRPLIEKLKPLYGIKEGGEE